MIDAEPRTRFNGRPKGVTNLSDNTKLGILSQKKLQMVTNTEIAEQFGVSRKTVSQMTDDSLSTPEAKQKLQRFVAKLDRAREKTIDNINVKLDNDEFPATAYANLFSTLHNSYRLETDQSTANIATNLESQVTATFRQMWGYAEADEAGKLAIDERIALAMARPVAAMLGESVEGK